MKLLTFRLARERYALAVDAVAEVAPAGTVRPVPRAPATILGLAERRGRVLAVLDLPRLFDDGPSEDGPAHVVSLASPHDGTALWVPARLTTGEGAPVPEPDRPKGTKGRVFVEGEPHLLLDLDALVGRGEVA
jgi:hypothetical protein